MARSYVRVALALALMAGAGCSGKPQPAESTAAPAAATDNAMSGSAGGTSGGQMKSKHHHGGSMAGGSMAGGTSGGSMAGGAGASIAHFTTEDAAQTHCPSDTVVWLNMTRRIYHLKGDSYYGHTKHGAFVCKTDADNAGDRAAKGG